MDDPIYRLRFDTDSAEWLFEQGPMGPGGGVSIDLDTGLSLTVDAADVGRVVQLAVEVSITGGSVVPEPSALEALAALMGVDAASFVANVGHDRTTTVRRRSSGRELANLGRLALLDDLRSENPSGWWAAEACYLCALADLRLGLKERAAREAPRGAQAILDLSRSSVTSGLDVPYLTQVTTAVAAVLESSDPDLAQSVRAVTASLQTQPLPVIDHVDRQFAHLATLSDITPVDLAPLFRGPSQRVVEGTFSIGVPEHEVHGPAGHLTWNRGKDVSAVELDGVEVPLQPSEMLVRVPAEVGSRPGAPPLWARVLLVRERSIVALAKLTTGSPLPNWAVARCAIPARLNLVDLAVEVTGEPMRRPDSALGIGLREACALARHAGMAARLRQWDQARVFWQGCARQWAALGDEARQATALLFAAECADKEPDPSAAAHLRRVAAQISADTRALASPSRGLVEPFLAESIRGPDPN